MKSTVCLLVLCLFLAHCPGKGAPEGGIGVIIDTCVVADGCVPPGPGPGLSDALPKSIYIPAPMALGGVQTYKVDIAPVEVVVGYANKVNKLTPAHPKFHGFKAKSGLQMRYANTGNTFKLGGVTPFNELVVLDAMTADHQAQLVDKDQKAVDVLKNRALYNGVAFYDDHHDVILFAEKGADGKTHFKSRDMKGQETDIHVDSKLSVYKPGKDFIYLVGSSGVFVYDITSQKKTQSTLKFSDPTSVSINIAFDPKAYVGLVSSDGVSLATADLGKSFSITKGVGVGADPRLLRPDLNEYIFVTYVMTPDGFKAPQVLQRLNLKDGTITQLSVDPVPAQTAVIDHVGDKYLLSQEGALSWLGSDGKVTAIGSISGDKNVGAISYNANNGTVLFYNTATNALTLFSSKDGKSLATATALMKPVSIFVNGRPVWVTFQQTKPGTVAVGLLSPDTLGGDSGTDLTPVPLGTMTDVQDLKVLAGTFGMSALAISDIHEDKPRTPAAVADMTPPVDCLKSGTCDPSLITPSNFQVTDALVVSDGTLQVVGGEIPKIKVTSTQPPQSVYVICGSNMPPYLIQKFVLSADPNDATLYGLTVTGLKSEISGSPKFLCTTTIIDASGNPQFLKLKVTAK